MSSPSAPLFSLFSFRIFPGLLVYCFANNPRKGGEWRLSLSSILIRVNRNFPPSRDTVLPETMSVNNSGGKTQSDFTRSPWRQITGFPRMCTASSTSPSHPYLSFTLFFLGSCGNTDAYFDFSIVVVDDPVKGKREQRLNRRDVKCIYFHCARARLFPRFFHHITRACDQERNLRITHPLC